MACLRGLFFDFAAALAWAAARPSAFTVIPAIAQLVEHLTVDFAGIRGSLVRFRVAGLLCGLSMLINIMSLPQSSILKPVRANLPGGAANLFLSIYPPLPHLLHSIWAPASSGRATAAGWILLPLVDQSKRLCGMRSSCSSLLIPLQLPHH